MPDNVRGIWTEIDDEGLRLLERWERRIKKGKKMDEEAKEVERRLLEKHGRKRMKLRMDFLKKLDVLDKSKRRRDDARYLA